MRRAEALLRISAGNSIAARMATIATTTSNSIRVKQERWPRGEGRVAKPALPKNRSFSFGRCTSEKFTVVRHSRDRSVFLKRHLCPGEQESRHCRFGKWTRLSTRENLWLPRECNSNCCG